MIISLYISIAIMTGFIYVRTHSSYTMHSVCKLGKTQDLVKRGYTYITGEYVKGKYIMIIKINNGYKHNHHQCERLLQKHLCQWHKRDTGGIEFYDDVILTMITPILNKYGVSYHIFTESEMKDAEQSEKLYIFNKSLQHDLLGIIKKRNKEQVCKLIHKNHMTQVMRELHDSCDYRGTIQKEYLTEIIHELSISGKAFLKAPTGFGKTRIIYNVIAKLRCARILIFTPRKLLNEQCTSNKYNKNRHHKVVHFSNSTNKEKTIMDAVYNTKLIMTSCYQSMTSLYQYIITYGMCFDLVVYDEAHYISDALPYKYGHLSLFASATPHNYNTENPAIFGKIIEKIHIYDLIKHDVLCNIITLIKKIDTVHKATESLCVLIIKATKQYNKRKGIVYMNSIHNARTLYHLISANINTYIYVSKTMSDIQPDRQNITLFESEKVSSIIICGGKISYGYDNEDIDFICLGDPRHSDIDIRQIIGRGLRWNHANYPDKVLHMMIPVYHDEFMTECSRLTKYLDYIIGECGQDIILHHCKFGLSTACEKAGGAGSHVKKYDGEIDDIEALQRYSTGYYSMYSNFMKFLRHNKIRNVAEYNELARHNEFIPDINTIQTRYPKFAFINLYHNSKYYSNKAECIESIALCKDILIKNDGITKYTIYNEDQKYKKYIGLDNKLPAMGLNLYYGI